MEIKDKTILMTGGARVGQVVARELAAAGANLALTFRSSGEEIASHLEVLRSEFGITTNAYKVDVSDEAQIRVGFAAAEKDTTSIDGLILMASIFEQDAQITFETMQRMFTINAFGNMLMARLFAEAAKKRGAINAPIVAFIDWAVDHPYDGYDTYIAAKAALRHYLMALQVSYAGHIRVVNIHPGMILEPKGFDPEIKANIIANTPTDSIGTPEQAARLVKTALENDYLVDNIYLAGGQQWRHRLQS